MTATGLDDAAFLRALVSTPHRTLETLVTRPRPARYATKSRLHLLDGSSGARRQAREWLLRVWGVHGRHDPQGPDLGRAVARLIHSGRGQHQMAVLEVDRQGLGARLPGLAGLLAQAGIALNYQTLYDDLTYHGERVRGRWLASFYQEEQQHAQADH